MEQGFTFAAAEELLRWMGVTRIYRGFRDTVWAVCLAVEDENRLNAVTKEIYAATAEHYKMGDKGYRKVERNIRTVVQRVWERQPERLDQLAGFSLDKRPAVSEVIALLANYIVRNSWESMAAMMKGR